MVKRLLDISCLAAMTAALALVVSGCASDVEEPDPTPSQKPAPQIVVMYGPGGLGDRGYMDCILSGVQNFKKDHHAGVDLYQYTPGSEDAAGRLLDEWLSLPESNVPALFVAASNEYGPVLSNALAKQQLTPNKRILYFESDDDMHLPVTTFRMSMYGASYLAGITAGECMKPHDENTEAKNALILLAYPGDKTIENAAEGFSAGFATAGSGARTFTEYLADDWTGYVSAQYAYQRMSDWSDKYAFVFPVAGGSNQGIYRFTREYPDSPLTAGMDVDQSGLSRNITGSVIKHIDKVIYDYLETWLTTGELPESEAFGLKSGYTDWLLSPHFAQFQPIVDAARNEAIRKEADKL